MDENSEGESMGANVPIDDEARLTSSEPGQTEIHSESHSDEGGADGESRVTSEIWNAKKAGAGTATADDDDENDIDRATRRLRIADEQ